MGPSYTVHPFSLIPGGSLMVLWYRQLTMEERIVFNSLRHEPDYTFTKVRGKGQQRFTIEWAPSR